MYNLIIVENVNTNHWFIGYRHSNYDLGPQWIPTTISFDIEEEYNEYLSKQDYSKLIDTPKLPLDEEWRALRGNLLHTIPKIENCSEHRKKIELILYDRQITGKSFIDAKYTVEEFLSNLNKY